ncbi:MAG TPA: hypothetical protein P5556_04460 [Candidatus Gastranaerophilales bacterium]|nr:hypothetical protein [Candidatus Gastranaerophilales bacterium]
MNGIQEIAYYKGIPEFILRKHLRDSLNLSDFSNVQSLNSRDLMTRLERLLGEEKLSFMGIGEINDNQRESPSEKIGQNLSLVA